MLKVFSQTFLGLLLCFSGLYVLYFYLTGINDGRSPLLLGLSVLLIAGGVFLFFRVGKSDATVVSKMKLDNPDTNQSANPGLENTLKKNNELMADWSKTNEAKQRLRMLELA